jgi:hypothetical protein
MVRRAKDLHLITDETYERHFRNMSAQGWRRAKGEPLDEQIPEVKLTVGRRCLEILDNSNEIKPWEIQGELPLPDEILDSVFGTKLKAMMPDEFNKIIVRGVFSETKPPASGNDERDCNL